MKTKRTTGGVAVISDRAKGAAAQAVPLGKRAGTTAAQGARQGVQGAREWAAPRLDDATDVVSAAGTTAVQNVRQGVQTAVDWATPKLEDAVQGAREWVAPRLEDAADAVTTTVATKVSSALTTTVAPKVSSALRSTAQQVRPAKSSKTGARRLLSWRWLLGIGAVLAGAGAATAVTMKRRYASATAEAKDATEASEDTPTSQPGEAVHSEVNGQVTN